MFTVAPLGANPCPVLNGSSAENAPTFMLCPPPGTPASGHCSTPVLSLCCGEAPSPGSPGPHAQWFGQNQSQKILSSSDQENPEPAKTSSNSDPHMLSRSLRPGWSFRVILSKLGETFAKSAETPTSKAGQARVACPSQTSTPVLHSFLHSHLPPTGVPTHPKLPLSSLLTWDLAVAAHDSISAVAAESWGDYISPVSHSGPT